MNQPRQQDPPNPPEPILCQPLTALPPLSAHEQEDVEDRRFRRWIIKTCIYAVLFCVVILVTATAIVGVKNGEFPDDGLIARLIDFAQQLVPVVNLIIGKGQ